MQQGCTNSLQS